MFEEKACIDVMSGSAVIIRLETTKGKRKLCGCLVVIVSCCRNNLTNLLSFYNRLQQRNSSVMY